VTWAAGLLKAPRRFGVQAGFRTIVLKRLQATLRVHHFLRIIIITMGQFCSVYPAGNVSQQDNFSDYLVHHGKREP